MYHLQEGALDFLKAGVYRHVAIPPLTSLKKVPPLSSCCTCMCLCSHIGRLLINVRLSLHPPLLLFMWGLQLHHFVFFLLCSSHWSLLSLQSFVHLLTFQHEKLLSPSARERGGEKEREREVCVANTCGKVYKLPNGNILYLYCAACLLFASRLPVLMHDVLYIRTCTFTLADNLWAYICIYHRSSVQSCPVLHTSHFPG